MPALEISSFYHFANRSLVTLNLMSSQPAACTTIRRCVQTALRSVVSRPAAERFRLVDARPGRTPRGSDDVTVNYCWTSGTACEKSWTAGSPISPTTIDELAERGEELARIRQAADRLAGEVDRVVVRHRRLVHAAVCPKPSATLLQRTAGRNEITGRGSFRGQQRRQRGGARTVDVGSGPATSIDSGALLSSARAA